MQTKTFAAVAAFAACVALAGASMAAPAAAPAAAAADQTPLPLNGPAVPGVCFLSEQEVFIGSTVGKNMFNRLQQLDQAWRADAQAQQTQIQTDAKALEAAHATLPADQYDQRAASLNLRARELERLADQRQREMQATKQLGLQTVGRYVQPILRQVVAERNCSMLLSDGGVEAIAPSMDISPAVIQRLDAAIQQFPLDRVHLDESPAAAGPQQ